MPIDWANISVGVSAIIGLIYIARTLRGVMRDQLRYAMEQNEFFGNHMSNIANALSKNTRVLEQLAREIKELRVGVK